MQIDIKSIQSDFFFLLLKISVCYLNLAPSSTYFCRVYIIYLLNAVLSSNFVIFLTGL